MTDMDKTIELLDKYEIGYHTTELYSSTTTAWCGYALWLGGNGHIEFDLNGKLTNIVNY